MKKEFKMKYAVKLSSYLILFLTVLWAGTTMAADLPITIDIAPKTLNLQNQGEVVTVHTDIAYSLVSSAEVWLNGQPIAWSKADARGNFVAKFDIEVIKGLNLEIGRYITLRLEGWTVTGDTFWGEAEVRVIDSGPRS
jgi:hypothetical protein